MSLLLVAVATAAAATAAKVNGKYYPVGSIIVHACPAHRVASSSSSAFVIGGPPSPSVAAIATRIFQRRAASSSSSSSSSLTSLASHRRRRRRRSRSSSAIAMSTPDENDDIVVVGARAPSSTNAADMDGAHDGINVNDEIGTANTIARLVSATPSSLDACGARLRSGLLVSFPTETVYGLGCHALDHNAVRRVFDAKERPLSDPLIVHGRGALGMDRDEDDARLRRRLVEGRALSALTSAFFPGPLTIVARARASMPSILMAGTGYVACRSPSHPVARELIRRAGVPIAAPSANKFGHVSPTSSHHVMDDLGMEDVWIVDPGLGTVDENGEGEHDDDDDDDDILVGGEGEISSSASSVCQVGVESTVVKVEMYTPSSPSGKGGEGEVVGSITVLRHGAISVRSIRASIEDAGLSSYFLVAESVRFTSEDTNNVAPGQMVRHYSPNVPCFMVGSSRQSKMARPDEEEEDSIKGGDSGAGDEKHPLLDEEERSVLSRSVIIDYGRRLARYREHALVYRDLSPDGDPATAASSVFETLRWSETIDGAVRVFVPELILGREGHDGADGDTSRGEIGALALAVKDKLTRAASAVVVARFQ
ncbi:hypothetical protein ACHAXA_009849 [Cyclostephanos tholiformis]|uniref:Threonylcarbamoyl-AMP synthase n=1 Tax=Cyclostephanos tholiformis TaxID=382380 RepID=A0ABD3R6K2_9STRA